MVGNRPFWPYSYHYGPWASVLAVSRHWSANFVIQAQQLAVMGRQLLSHCNGMRNPMQNAASLADRRFR